MDNVKRELNDMALLLKDLQQGTKTLLNEKTKVIISKEERCMKATSAWGKSTTARVPLPNARTSSNTRTLTNAATPVDYERLANAEKVVKQRPPAYSMGKSVRPSVVDTPVGSCGPASSMYNVKVDMLSTYTKPKGVFFSSTPRHPQSESKRLKQELDAESTRQPPVSSQMVASDADGDSIHSDSDPSTAQPKSAAVKIKRQSGYSFGKASRDNVCTPAKPPGPEAKATAPLDIAAGEKYLWGTPSAPVMKPPVVVPKIVKEPTSIVDQSEAQLLTVESELEQGHLGNSLSATGGPTRTDFLSKHISVPGISFGKVSSPTIHIKLNQARNAIQTGPGYYQTNDDMYDQIHKDKNRGKVYHESKAGRPRSASALNRVPSTPGPGYYAVEKSEQHFRNSNTRNISFGPSPADAKLTPQLERKRMREEKLEDLRDFHDQQALANDSVIKPRVSAVKIVPPVDETADVVRYKIKRQREYQDKLMAEIAREYEREGVKYNAVERGPKALVTMAAQVEAKRSINEYIASRPGVLKVKADKMVADINKDVFYGPQLPVKWAPDRHELSKSLSIAVGGDHEDMELEGPQVHEMSPTDDIRKMLEERKKRRSGSANGTPTSNSTKHRSTAADTSQSKLPESATASAYLKSSFSGHMAKKQLTLYKDHDTVSRKHLIIDDVVQAPDYYLGPETWTERKKEHEGRSLQMALSKGRDDIKVHTKGLVEVQEFSSHVVPKSDAIGPGAYTDDDILTQFGKQGGQVKFDKMVARDEVVGPRGEKPENAKIKLHEILDDPFYAETQLDVDYGLAKDAATAKKEIKNAMKLYSKDRHEPVKPAIEKGEDSDGMPAVPKTEPGDWFKGMYAEVQSKKGGALDFDKMMGRDDFEETPDFLEGEFAKHELDLEVKEWKPHMRRVVATTFKDPDVYPRFQQEETKADGEGGAKGLVASSLTRVDLEAAKSKLSGYREAPFFVDISKMAGRSERAQGHSSKLQEAELNEIINGKDDIEAAIRIETERSEAVQKAIELTSKELKRVRHVDMSKQVGSRFEEPPAIPEIPEVGLIREEAKSPSKDQRKAAVKGGGGDWSKAPPARGVNSKEAEREANKLLGHDSEELVLDVSNAKNASSKSKSLISGPAWASSKVESSRLSLPVSAAPDVVYDADPGKFKKGYTAIGEVKPHSKTSFANQNSRGTDRHQEKALKELLGEPEEVVVDPSDDALKSRVRGGSRMGPPRQPSSGSAKASATASAGTKPAAFQAATRADVVLPSTSDPTEGTSEKSPRQGPKGRVRFQDSSPEVDTQVLDLSPRSSVGPSSNVPAVVKPASVTDPINLPSGGNHERSSVSIEPKVNVIRSGKSDVTGNGLGGRSRDLSFASVKYGDENDQQQVDSTISSARRNSDSRIKIKDDTAMPADLGLDSPIASLRAPDVSGIRPSTPKAMKQSGKSEAEFLQKLTADLSEMNV